MYATPMSDELARDLGSSHHCDVSFLAGGELVASSLPPQDRAALKTIAQLHATQTAAFDAPNCCRRPLTLSLFTIASR